MRARSDAPHGLRSKEREQRVTFPSCGDLLPLLGLLLLGACAGGTKADRGGDVTGGSATRGGVGRVRGADDSGGARSGGTELCQNGEDTLGNGYSLEFWTNQPGSACMTVFGDEATFKCNWTDTVEFLALVGLGYDATQTPDEVRTFSPDFTVTGSGSGLVCVGIYGHTKDPLVKCHVIADWVNEPDGLAAAPDVDDGTLVVDGGPDTVYHRTVGDGSTPLRPYYSIRTERRRCGHISIPEPFSQWADKDMPMGQPVRVMLFVKGMNHGSGSYEFTKATVTVQ